MLQKAAEAKPSDMSSIMILPRGSVYLGPVPQTKGSYLPPTERQVICYCEGCQKILSALFAVNLMVPTEKFRFTAGKAQISSYTGKHVLGMP